MAICVIFISFLLGFTNVVCKLPETKLRKAFVITTIVFSVLTVFITEILSAFKAINFYSILSCWLFILLLNFSLLYRNKEKFLEKGKIAIISIKHQYSLLTLHFRIVAIIICLLLILLFIQGIIYPPNNWDSMTYHMSRIMFWLSNNSVEHYPTHIMRQIYQPPFTEFVILNFNILNGADYFSNSVQLFYLIATCILLVEVISLFSSNPNIKLFAVVLVITLPEAILQATNTKNDLVVSFFILSSIYYSIIILKKCSVTNVILLGTSVGLAMLTKGTSYIFLAPVLILLLCGAAMQIFKDRTYRFIPLGFFAILIAVLLNAGHYYRNYKLNGNILSIEKVESGELVNKNMGMKLLLSNILKNASLHTSPAPLNKIADDNIRKVHDKLNIPIDNPDTNYYNMPYQAAKDITTHEDYASNTILFFVIILSLIGAAILFFIKKTLRLPLTLIIITLVSQIILFSAYLKWQPWHTRLHTPIFFTGIILVCFLITYSKWFRAVLFRTTEILLVSCFFIILCNNVRPYLFHSSLTSNLTLSDERYKKYFANQMHLYPEYSMAIYKIGNLNVKSIGLMMNEWEYPLLCKTYNEDIKAFSISVDNVTNKALASQSIPDCIISNTVNKPTIEHMGKKYYNTDVKNQFLWFYK